MASLSARLQSKREAYKSSLPSKKKDRVEDGQHTLEFFDIPCEELAKKLLGQVLVRVLDGEVYKGKIVETEAYLGAFDKAAHSYKGKRTTRNEAMFMAPGTSYVYSIYGMYHCFNVSSAGEGAAVLIRALEPLEGIEDMKKTRAKNSKKKDCLPSSIAVKDLCNGPSKLCSAFKIDKDLNKLDITSSDLLWVEQPQHDITGDGCEDEDVICCPRIGVDYAEEWSRKDLRFYLRGSSCVSKRDRDKEKIHSTNTKHKSNSTQ